MIKRAIKGVTVNEDTIALDVIKKVATSEKQGVNFLAESHTRKHMRSELYMPRLADRSRRSTWQKKGAKNIIERAREKVDSILQEHQPNELEKTMENKLLDYMKTVINQYVIYV